jgi:hypothetical protein
VSGQSEIVRGVGHLISEHLGEIAALFKPGTKLTLLARQPHMPDGSQDMVLTDDTLDRAIAALVIRRDLECKPPT